MSPDPENTDRRDSAQNPPEQAGSDAPTLSGKDLRGTVKGANQVQVEATVAFNNGAIAETPPGRLRPGKVFGEYELEEEIARGGMGVVYRAKHRKLNRTVALKMILSGQFASEEDIRRFFLEAEAAASLDHPGIVQIYEIGQHEGQHFFSMKYIEGGRLADRLEELRRDSRKVLELLVKVVRAVHHAHQRGILHRDLKPANILLDEQGEPLVSDLGLAKHLAAGSDVTRTGAVLGTPGYMSPEQAEGTREVTTAADIYSLGAILYQILVGRPPHGGTTPLETVMKVLNEKPIRPRDVDSKIDRGLELICLKCLEKDPNARYSSAAALAEDLERWLAGQPISLRPPSLSSMFGMWLRGNLRSAGGAVVAGLIAGCSLAAVFWMTSMSKPMSVGAGIYEHFPSEQRPLFALEPTPRDAGSELLWIWVLTATLMSMGLLNVLLVRPTNRAAMIGSGVIAGLVASLVAFAVSIGWGAVFSSVVWPVHQDLQDIAGAALANTPEEAERSQRALLRRYPDLVSAPLGERGNLVFQKIYMDQLTGIPIGLWLGIVGTLIVGMIPAISGTLIAGSLMQQRQRFASIVAPYVEIVGTASLACLFLVLNSVARSAGLTIIAPPLHYQLPFYASLLLASFAAYRSWNLPWRSALHIAWVVVAVFYFGEIGKTARASQIAADLVEQGRLEDAAIRIERSSTNRRWEAFPQFSAAVLRARLGQWDRHAAHCRDMAQRFSRTSDPFAADQTAKACFLSAQPVGLETAMRLADVAVQEGKGSDFEPWFEFAQGLAAYRTENYGLVAEHLARAEKTEMHFFAATSVLLRSMACRKLQQPRQADQLQQQAHQRYESALQAATTEALKEVWLDRLVFEVLYDEARRDALADGI